MSWQRLVDDRGSRHKVCAIHQVAKSSGMGRNVFVGGKDAGRFWPAFLLTGTLFAIGMQVYSLVFNSNRPVVLFTPSGFLVAAFHFIGFGIPMGLMVKFSGWRSVEHAKYAVLSIGYCPSCAYRLFDLESKDDKCVVCPECSGAWILPDAMNSV